MRPRVGSCATALLLAAASLLTGAAAAPVAQPPAAARLRVGTGQLVVHTRTVEIGPTTEPRLFTTLCVAGEQLVSGGYTGQDPAARVIVSYPSDANATQTRAGEQPRGWSVGVLNGTRGVLRMQVVAACLANGDGRSSMQVTTETRTENRFSLSADCPDATVRTGGGYSSVWAPASGTAAVTGSYPAARRRWSIDVTMPPIDSASRARASVSVYAVCLSGPVQVAEFAPVNLELASGTPVCTGDATFARVCVTPRSGTQSVRCAAGRVLTGGGYQVATGTLPGNSSVISAAATAGSTWDLAVRGSSPTAAPISIRVTPLCLAPVAGAAATTAVDTVVATEAPEQQPTAGSTPELYRPLLIAAIVFLIVLALLLLAVSRMWGRRPADARENRRPIGDPHLEVVARGHRSAYRLRDFRELP